MTPHSLRLSGFGPFAGTVSVDLDALSSAGLFLLHGPTGGGKTTLLDGIGFALFGRVPGARNAARRLRSDHALPGTATEVCLEATFGGRRIRITRSPSYDRPKSRGTGTTLQQASVLLEELRGGQWETLSSRPREADDEILDLVGMNAEQFFQVVLLPQGEFAQFLRASSVDRAALLQKLFSTERFADVETWLGNRRRICAERVASARVAVDEVLARIEEASGARGEPADLLAISVTAESDAAALVAAAVLARDLRRVESESAVRLADLQQRRRSVLDRAAQLEASRPERLALQAERTLAARAAEVAGVLAAEQHRRATRDLALEQLCPVAGLEEAPAGELRALASAALARRASLEALRAVDDVRREAVATADRARSEQADALAAAAASEAELGALPVRRDELELHLAAARTAAATLPVLTGERDQLSAVRPDLVALAQSMGEVASRRELCMSAGETALALKTKALELRVANVNSMVAKLAFRLEQGVPCEVCGSREHPDPSALRDEGVSVEDEERAQAEADAAEAVAARLQQALATSVARVGDLTARVGAWTLALLDDRLAEVDLELGVLASRAAQVERRELDLSALEGRRSELEKAHVAAESRAEAAARRGRDALALAQSQSEQLAAAGATDLAAALAEAERSAVALDGAASAAEALVMAQHELSAAAVTVEKACDTAGFGSSDEARAAFRDARWQERTDAALREAADAEAAVAEALADPSLDVPLEPAAPVRETTSALAAADAVLGQAQREHGTAAARRTALDRLLPLLAAARAALEPLETESAQVRALADLCAGQGANTMRMTLTSFVLAARLEEVAAAATVRLLRMTQGRYELVHTDGAARGGVRSGLGLLVRDAWTGQDRDTATLSGGETFLASLSLALGLADVVTAEAGGARIGALFVDEGFGTLDEETLDEVMDVLDGLREGGRVVGLVSHVAELRQRIPVRLEVRKGRAGSDLVAHGC
jgi:exonuclease SbcC